MSNSIKTTRFKVLAEDHKSALVNIKNYKVWIEKKFIKKGELTFNIIIYINTDLVYVTDDGRKVSGQQLVD